jgi:uncharacterized membrane protein YphA (DoxX/SURF4 family)
MRKSADWLLRIALAFSFLYPPINAWTNPFSWSGYIAKFALAAWPWGDLSLLHTFGVAEIVLAVWLLSGWRIWIPATLMGLILVVIVATNPGQFEVLFRDLSIAGLAFGIAFFHSPRTVAHLS